MVDELRGDDQMAVSKMIFNEENGSGESSLYMKADGSFEYFSENSSWKMARKGLNTVRQSLTADEAADRFPAHAEAIKDAVAGVLK